jgi:hypothetical protein
VVVPEPAPGSDELLEAKHFVATLFPVVNVVHLKQLLPDFTKTGLCPNVLATLKASALPAVTKIAAALKMTFPFFIKWLLFRFQKAKL